MAKYSEKDVVRIKNQIKILSEEVSSANNKLTSLDEIKNKKLSEIKQIEFVIEQKRELANSALDKRRNEILELENRNQKLESDFLLMSKHFKAMISLIEEAKNTIIRLNLKKLEILDKNSMELKRGEDLDSNIEQRKSSLDRMIEIYKRIQSEELEKVGIVKNDKQVILSNISETKDKLESMRVEIDKLNIELERSRRELLNLQNREKNVRAMEIRLTPEYRSVYERLSKRK